MRYAGIAANAGFYALFSLQKIQILGERNVFLSCCVVILGGTNVIFISTDMNFLLHFRFYLDRITSDLIHSSSLLVHSCFYLPPISPGQVVLSSKQKTTIIL